MRGHNLINANLSKLNNKINTSELITIGTSLTAYKRNNIIEVYKTLNNLGSGTTIDFGLTDYLPKHDFAIIPVYSTTAPYVQIGTVWISRASKYVKLYKPSNVANVYVYGSYSV